MKLSNNNLNSMRFTTLANLAHKYKLYKKVCWYYINIKKIYPEIGKYYTFNEVHLNNTVSINTNIEIILTVYNSLHDVKKCINSLLSNTDKNFTRIIVINDYSNKQVSKYLRDVFLMDNNIILLENYKNMGYTKSINIGLKLSTSDYVITLNSDTIVSKGWTEKMLNIFNTNQNIGMVGPLSNAATWQNIPKLKDNNNKFLVNDLPKNTTVEEMAILVAKCSNKSFPQVELLNGFCIMIRREVIEKVGYMDEEFFPLGYGEETDYCIRVKEVGFDLVIADNVYVYHAKSKSFGNEKRKELSARGEAAIKYKHGYKAYLDIKKRMDTNKELFRIRSNIKIKIEQLSKDHGSDDY